MRKRGVIGIAAGLIWMSAGCGSVEAPRTDDVAATATKTTSARTTTTPRPSPSPTPSATATLNPALVVHECEPVSDQALIAQLAATILWPYNQPEFVLNGVFSLRTTHMGNSWAYVAARLGGTINGELRNVAVWAVPDGQLPVGVKLGRDSDLDGDLDNTHPPSEIFSTPGDPALYPEYSGDLTRVIGCALDAPGASNINTRMTLAQYEQLTPGSTTLDQLYALVGERVCEESSESTIGGITTLGLTCRGDGQPGANAVLIFQGGALVSKAQAGLA
jgi:hypothetical protein